MAKKVCQKCGTEKSTAQYISVNSKIHGASLPICRDCIAQIINEGSEEGKSWNIVNKLCQWADIPFVPEVWDQQYQARGKDAFGFYCQIFRNKPYDTLDWQMYNEVYLQILEENRVEDALPAVNEKKIRDLRRKWGQEYDEQDLEYLENLHSGMMNSQNIVGALNEDQALKLCKISLIIEQKIRAGEDFDKDLRAYDALTKLANFTPKVVKDGREFSSFGEVFAYLEKKGWINDYYDDEVRDEADFTTKDIKLWLQYLYVNETGVAEEIEQRINNIKTASQLQNENFNEEEFREYIKEQGAAPLDEEEFSIEY